MDLTACFSYVSIHTMCVRGLGDLLLGAVRCVENSIWLGVSLGAVVASETALFCEIALGQSRAVVAVDNRSRYPQ